MVALLKRDKPIRSILSTFSLVVDALKSGSLLYYISSKLSLMARVIDSG